MEDRDSLSLLKLNKEYLDLYYSLDYQKILRKKRVKNMLRNKDIHGLITGIKGVLRRSQLISPQMVCLNEKVEETVKINPHKDKIAVYTCITGGYDSIKEPLYVNPDIDYLVFTDGEVPANSVWKKFDINAIEEIRKLDNKDKNRAIKILPHVFLSGYDYTIYVDGCITIITDMLPVIEHMGSKLLGVHLHQTRDCIYMEAEGVIHSGRASAELVNKQMSRYKREGYPRHYGLYENTILVRPNRNQRTIKLMDDWWKEYLLLSKRDQLSLPYVIWKNNVDKNDLYIMGADLNRNPRFRRAASHAK